MKTEENRNHYTKTALIVAEYILQDQIKTAQTLITNLESTISLSKKEFEYYCKHYYI